MKLHIRSHPVNSMQIKWNGKASYGIILGGNSSYSKKIFTLQKRIIRTMVGTHPRTSGIRLFKKLEILTVPTQYIHSLMSFFIGNQENFQSDSSVHNINTRYKHHLHTPVANLSFFSERCILLWDQNF